ncbi:MAG: LOG family protein [Thermoguttaceae bacterium]|nr:LOG family protein [Thermoguttaceae bacterium]
MSPKRSDGVDRAQLQTELLNAPAYRKAYRDPEFLSGDDGREIRLLAEYAKPERAFEKAQIGSTVVVFGSARLLPPDEAARRLELAEQAAAQTPGPDADEALRKARAAVALAPYYQTAREFAELAATKNDVFNREIGPDGVFYPTKRREFVVCTGGGPGVMEAANRGAFDADEPTIALNIALPFEQQPNPFVSPELSFNFHYFAIRKLHFLLRAKALVAFPGGFGTFDELFEALTLRQTERMQHLPIVLFGREFWESVVNFPKLVEYGVISPGDLDLFQYAETAEEGWAIVENYYANEAIRQN